MQWFKHYSDYSSSTRMQELLDAHGTNGTHAWNILRELMAKNYDIHNPGHFKFSKRKLFEEIFPRCCHKTKIKILDHFKSWGDFDYRIDGKLICIKCEEIKELADEYTIKCLRDEHKKVSKIVRTNSGDGVRSSSSSLSSSKGNSNTDDLGYGEMSPEDEAIWKEVIEPLDKK